MPKYITEFMPGGGIKITEIKDVTPKPINPEPIKVENITPKPIEVPKAIITIPTNEAEKTDELHGIKEEELVAAIEDNVNNENEKGIDVIIDDSGISTEQPVVEEKKEEVKAITPKKGKKKNNA